MRSSSRTGQALRLLTLLALLAASALAAFAEGEERSAGHGAGAGKGAGAKPSAYSFYENGNGFLAVAEPIFIGEEGLVARARALAEGGEPFGLVLSGGSARAYAHIGVLKALEEAGIRPDYLVSDSMGAIIALLYGAGVSPEDIERLFGAFPAMSLFDLELPLQGGFVDSASFKALIRALAGELDLADLPLPILIICEDLVTRRQVRIASGDFTTMMAASFVLPGVFRPVRLGSFVLVDGGAIGLVPVEAAYRYGGRVAVSTALYDRELDYGNAFVDLNRAIDIAKTRRSVEELLARRPPVIRCDVEGLSFMQFSKPREVAARGYESARALLPDLLALSPPRPLPPALLERRAYFHERIGELIAAKGRDTLLPLPADFRVVCRARLADEAEGGFSYLSGLRFAGLSALARKGAFSGGLALLSGLSGDPESAWGAELDLGAGGGTIGRAGLSAFLKATAYLFGSYGEGEGPSPSSLIMTGEAGLAISGERGPLLLPQARAEARRPFDAGGLADWELQGGAALASRRGGPLSADCGLYYLEDSGGNRGAAARLRCSAELGLPTAAQAEAAGRLALRLRAAGRAAYEGPGFGPSADSGFRGEPLALEAAWRAYGGLDALWLASPLELDFGELLIVQRPELGLYADLLGAGPSLSSGGTPESRLVIGLAAALGLSTFGLTPYELSFYCGWGLDGSGLSLSLRSGRIFK